MQIAFCQFQIFFHIFLWPDRAELMVCLLGDHRTISYKSQAEKDLRFIDVNCKFKFYPYPFHVELSLSHERFTPSHTY